jgi:hypothetical protein
MSAPLFGRATLAALSLLLPAATAAAPPPLTAYGQLPAMSGVVLSPDGTRYAAMTTSRPRSRCAALPTAS